MCGRFTSTATTDELMRRFGVTILQNLRPRWNIAPSQNSMVLVRDGLHLQAKTAAWGLPPTGPNKSFLINARMETVREKPTFRDAFSLSRCIVVASGWYEWSAPKTPWHIQLSDGGVMAMAGLLFQQGSQSRFVIMTSAADGKLAEVHHRQPLVLAAGTEMQWLGGTADQAANYCEIAPASWFNWHRVAPDVGKAGIDHQGSGGRSSRLRRLCPSPDRDPRDVGGSARGRRIGSTRGGFPGPSLLPDSDVRRGVRGCTRPCR